MHAPEQDVQQRLRQLQESLAASCPASTLLLLLLQCLGCPEECWQLPQQLHQGSIWHQAQAGPALMQGRQYCSCNASRCLQRDAMTQGRFRNSVESTQT
jgi:hypothetical protein